MQCCRSAIIKRFREKDIIKCLIYSIWKSFSVMFCCVCKEQSKGHINWAFCCKDDHVNPAMYICIYICFDKQNKYIKESFTHLQKTIKTLQIQHFLFNLPINCIYHYNTYVCGPYLETASEKYFAKINKLGVFLLSNDHHRLLKKTDTAADINCCLRKLTFENMSRIHLEKWWPTFIQLSVSQQLFFFFFLLHHHQHLISCQDYNTAMQWFCV